MSPTPYTHTHLRTLLGGIMGLIMSFGLTSPVSATDYVSLVLDSPATIALGEEVRLFPQVDQLPRDTNPKYCVFTDSTGFRQVVTGTIYFDPNGGPDMQDQINPTHWKPIVFTPTSPGTITYRFGCGSTSLAEPDLLYAEQTVKVILTGKCTGVEPWLSSQHSEIYPNDSADIVSDTPWLYSETDTNRKCEWHCASGYQAGQNQGGQFACEAIPSDDDQTPISEVTINISANPNVIESGQTTTLTWQTTKAVSCQIKGDFDPDLVTWTDVPVNGSIVGRPSQTGYYHLWCLDSQGLGQITNPNGQPFLGAKVQVGFFPAILEFTATPSDGSTVLSWSFKNDGASGCSLQENVRNDGQLGNNVILDTLSTAKGTQVGTRVVTPQVTTTYILFCQQDGSAYGTGPKQYVTVTLSGNATPPPLPPGSPSPGSPSSPGGDGTCQSPNTCVSGGCAPDKYKPTPGTCGDTGLSCCAPLALPSPGVGYFNPLKYNSLDSVLTAVLSTLQSIIVVLSIIMIIVGAVMYILSAGNESRVSQAKVAITASVVGLALAIAAPAFLKEIGELLGWIEVTQVVEEAQTFTEIASKVLSFLLSIVGIIAIIMLVIGGLMYLTAGGDEGKAETGKKIVTYATIAIAIALAALVLVTQVAGFFG